ncbi:DUF2306 domain-containing protein [Maribacter antarcticus]|uniref:hypothetical protein n=1 Tax=Maribacter antarcticus TaxID=505250 RepID=UPI00056A008F|nr:hypothetical protein [Maribacter antarcticus]
MEQTLTVLIYVHASFGAMALFFGSMALMVKKGSRWHKRCGSIFYYSMLASALISLVVAVLPGHYNPFLFSIGIFTVYLLLSGYRALSFREKVLSLKLDKAISLTVIGVGAAMVLGPIVFGGIVNIVLFVFGAAAAVFGIRDLKMFKKPQTLKGQWLKIHLGKMTGAYIASVSAFLVVNDFLPSLLNWFLPTILGSLYITYWMFKIKKKNASTKII